MADIQLSSVSLTDAEIDAVTDAVLRGALSGTAPDVGQLEEALRRVTGAAYAVAVNSGTSALELALTALKLPAGSSVIVPAFTFAAPASAIVNAGLRPLLCDVSEATWTVDPEKCAESVDEDVSAIIAVDIMGNPCEYERLSTLRLPIIGDAAEAIGAAYQGMPLAASADVSVLSFHANKVVAGGEGGAVLTGDADLANSVRLLANHGMGAGYVHSVAGRNLRMHNLTAAFINAQLARLTTLIDRRNDVKARYREGLRDLPLIWQVPTAGATPITWLTAVRLEGRDALVSHLRSDGVDARAVWPSLEFQPFMSDYARRCPVSARLAAECMWLPTHADMLDSEVEYVIESVRRFFAGSW